LIRIFTYFQHKPRQKFNRSFFNLIFHEKKSISSQVVITIPNRDKMTAKLSRMFNRLLISYLRRYLHHSSFVVLHVYKKQWNAHKFKWLDPNFCLGPLCCFRQNLKTFRMFCKPLVPTTTELKVAYKHSTFRFVLCQGNLFISILSLYFPSAELST